jgi:16S rRNA (guanine527-N7)-methyltransferase
MGSAASSDQRLDALAARYNLPAGATNQLRSLLGLLVTDQFAPTTVRDWGKVIDDHFADSLVALELKEVRSASDVADLGSGAGPPGLPLAIVMPSARFFLVESTQRKCEFLERAVRRCGATNAVIVHSRVETWDEGLGRFDLVTARALAPLATVAEYAAPLLKIGGVLVAWRGRREPAGEAAAARAAGELGLEVGPVRSVQPYPEAEHRHLHLMSKVMETPDRFPRRPGAAVKRPLGAI